MAWAGKEKDVTITSDTAQTITTVAIREGAEYLWGEVANADHKGLDAFIIAVQPVSDASWHQVANAASDYTSSIQYPLQACSVDLTTLAKNTAGAFSAYVKGLYKIRFQASTAAGSDTTLSLRWKQR